MGCCLASEMNRDVDLPAPDLSKFGGNPFLKFEKSLPFCRTYVDAFEKRVRKAADLTAGPEWDEHQEKTETTLEDLRKTFTTSAWADLNSDDSLISRLVTHDVFKSDGGKIGVEKLVAFGVLTCAGTPDYKSTVLYGMFQYGGFERQQFLSANDKDITPALEGMMNLCTVEVNKLMQDLAEVHAMDELEDKAEDISYVVEAFIEEYYLTPLFGDNSRLSYEDFMTNNQGNAALHEIWFDAENLRSLVLSNIDMLDGDRADKFEALCSKLQIKPKAEE